MDREIQIKVMLKVRENLEYLMAVTGQLTDLVHLMLDAADRMAQGLGQEPDAPPLPPVEQFLAEVAGSKEIVNELTATLQLIGHNHGLIAEAITDPPLQ
jgi:hypothetical protein